MCATDSSSGRPPYKPLTLREHFRFRRFSLFHDDLRAFTQSSWLPLPVFVGYRIFLSVYLAGWIVATIVDRRDTDGAHWLIYITNWSFALFLAATIFAAIITLIFSIKPSMLTTKDRDRTSFPAENENAPSKDTIHWLVKIFWVLYITSHTVTVMVCIGFWSTQYETCNTGKSNTTSADEGMMDRNDSKELKSCGADVLSIHVHGINAVLAIVDILLSLVPFNALHFLHPCIFTLAYVVFSGIYYAAGGKNESGEPYLYSLLNYKERPVASSIAAILLVFLPACMYIIPLLVACIRDRLYQWITGNHCQCTSRVSRKENGVQEHKQKLNLRNPCTNPCIQ